MSFEDLGLSEEVLKAVKEAGYEDPTPIQEKAIPYVLMARDLLACAQTGTGKTAGFTLPMIDILSVGRAKARMPRSLILEPTRELAAQVAESFDKYGKYSKLSKALLIGGTSFEDQEKLLDRGVDVLIATPGRLLDHFERGKVLLHDVKVFVIDEADRMLDMGFIPDIERIVGLLPPLRQTLLFSATMPKEIRRLADKFLSNPKEMSVSPPATTAETVKDALVTVSPREKDKALQTLLDDESIESGLIFCNRKRDVDALNRKLRKAGYGVDALHGDMAQSARTQTLEKFRTGEIKLLVASDVAARGLDIPKVSHVFNYDVPHNPEDYVHRIGRTGRAGRPGKAFTIVTPSEKNALDNIFDLIKRKIPVLEEGKEGADAAPVGDEKEETKPAAEKRQGAKKDKGKQKAPPKEKSAKGNGRERGRKKRNGKERGPSPRGNKENAPPMDHDENTTGLGDHVPDFLRRPVR